MEQSIRKRLFSITVLPCFSLSKNVTIQGIEEDNSITGFRNNRITKGVKGKMSKSISPHKSNRKSVSCLNLNEWKSQDMRSLTLSVISSQSDVSMSTQGVRLSPTVPLSGMLKSNLLNIAHPNNAHWNQQFLLLPNSKLDQSLSIKNNKQKSMTNKEHFFSSLSKKENNSNAQMKAEKFLHRLAKELRLLRKIPTPNNAQQMNKSNLKVVRRRGLRRKRRLTTKNLHKNNIVSLSYCLNEIEMDMDKKDKIQSDCSTESDRRNSFPSNPSDNLANPGLSKNFNL